MHESVEASVDVQRQSESAGGLEADEPVQRGAQRAGCVDGVVTTQLVAGQDVGCDRYDGPACVDIVLVSVRRRALRRGVASRVLVCPSAVGV